MTRRIPAVTTWENQRNAVRALVWGWADFGSEASTARQDYLRNTWGLSGPALKTVERDAVTIRDYFPELSFKR
jgi:hypothetical protein